MNMLKIKPNITKHTAFTVVTKITFGLFYLTDSNKRPNAVIFKDWLVELLLKIHHGWFSW